MKIDVSLLVGIGPVRLGRDAQFSGSYPPQHNQPSIFVSVMNKPIATAAQETGIGIWPDAAPPAANSSKKNPIVRMRHLRNL